MKKTVVITGESDGTKVVGFALFSYSGQILLDGHDIRTLNLRWLRQQLGLVSQEPVLFATSIKENLLLGRPDATQVEIEEAARVSNAHSFIVKLPQGYDTQVLFNASVPLSFLLHIASTVSSAPMNSGLHFFFKII